jgi:hypothetical protein
MDILIRIIILLNILWILLIIYNLKKVYVKPWINFYHILMLFIWVGILGVLLGEWLVDVWF